MIWLQLKQFTSIVLIALNLFLLIRAVIAYRKRVVLADGYLRWLRVSPAVTLILPLLGLFFLARGSVAHGMHIFYGVLVTLGAGGQLLLSGRSEIAQRYRSRPLVHGFLALFVILLTARSWMSG